jgi:anhydro-N-acetylmuramic acid kinase
VIDYLAALVAKPERRILGLMSGTSMDGVDAALVRVRGAGTSTRCDLLHFLCYPYAADLRAELLDVGSGRMLSPLDLAELDFRVASAFAAAVRALLDAAGCGPAEVDLIGSHGQTLAHRAPGGEGRELQAATWQAGRPSAIAALCGIPVFGDFRSADMALGGTGAPLVPYADWLLRRSPRENRVLLNLGGIANLTFLAAGGGIDSVLAWDVGPGNMILDGLARALLGQEMDADGALAGTGRAAAAWVEALLDEEYFLRPPPKAAGREQFGAPYTQRLLHEGRERGLGPADLLATGVELTARAVARALRQPPLAGERIDAVYVAGGGRRNATLLRRLRELLAPARVDGFEVLGVDANAKEAVDFAILANESLHGHAGNLTAVTGASRPCILGVFAPAGLAPRPLAPDPSL